MPKVTHAIIEWNGPDSKALVSLWIDGERTMSHIDGALLVDEIATAVEEAALADDARDKAAAEREAREVEHTEINRQREAKILSDRKKANLE